VISLDTHPRLASKARLRFDRRSGRHLLLYPERGLLLNSTAADIVRLATGEHTVGAIVDRLSEQHPTTAREVIQQEALAFLGSLARRGLLEEAP
jgi:coenzyme PQQ biosynthesis protein PqqD